MKKKLKEELRLKSVNELLAEVGKRQEGILRLRMDLKLNKLKNTSQLKSRLDEIAVIKTILQEKK